MLKIKKVKIGQFLFGAVALLSLFTSSIVACACSHHQEKAEVSSEHCHGQAAETMAVENHHGTGQTEIVQNQISLPECCLVQPLPRAFAKSQTVQLEKQVAAILLLTVIRLVAVAKAVPERIEFTKPLYLSDSFYNLSPGRAPPRL